MSLKTYDDFMSLGNNKLREYLLVRGLNVTGKKAELVARGGGGGGGWRWRMGRDVGVWGAGGG